MGATFFGNDSPLNFGRFDQALLTLFRVTAGMGWIDQTLPMMDADGTVDWRVTAFVVTYVIVTNWTLLQVCVAILLDNFIKASMETRKAAETAQMSDAISRTLFFNALDPLLESIMASHTDDADLSARLQQLFKVKISLKCKFSGC